MRDRVKLWPTFSWRTFSTCRVHPPVNTVNKRCVHTSVNTARKSACATTSAGGWTSVGVRKCAGGTKSAAATVVLCMMLAGCGSIGEPLYPALHIPSLVTDLTVVEQGSN